MVVAFVFQILNLSSNLLIDQVENPTLFKNDYKLKQLKVIYNDFYEIFAWRKLKKLKFLFIFSTIVEHIKMIQ